MMETWKGSRMPRTIPQALRALENSEAIALICGREQSSYRELLADARQAACALCARGVSKGDRVVLDMSRSGDYIRAYLGCIYSGAVSVTIHSGWPEKQRSQVISDCSPVMIIDDDAARELLSSGKDDKQAPCPFPDICEGDPFQIIYTSGSTGRPKGVANSHQLALSSLPLGEDPEKESLMREYFTCNFSRVLLDSNLAFALTSGLIFRAFLYEKTLVLATEEEIQTASSLAACIIRTGADNLHGTASRFLQYLEDPEFEAAISNLSLIIFVGEKASEKVLDVLDAVGAELRYTYASTEAWICMFSPPCHRDEDILYETPIEAMPVYLIQEGGMAEALPGERGELCVGGAAGRYGCYWQDPELTEKKFFIHPLYGRLFRTGDLARREENGLLRILGRLDKMTKLHGQRIETEAIESAMEVFPGIERAAVKVQNGCSGEVLTGYYTGSADEGALRRELAKSLPYYMVPAMFMKLLAMPLNANGKLDYRALPCPQAKKEEYAAPRSPEEKLLCELFEKFLETEYPVGVNDSFFALGGDSIRAMACAAMLREKGYVLKLEWLFAAPTPGMLAPMLEKIKPDSKEQVLWTLELSDTEWESVERIARRENVEAVYPVLPGVKIFLDAKNPGWMCHAFFVDDSFTREELKKRMDESLRCHQALRSVFVFEDNNRPMQVVLRQWPAKTFFVDIRRLAAAGGGNEELSGAQRNYLYGLYRQLVSKPLSGTEVMMEAGLVKISDSCSVLVLNISHLLLDGHGFSLIYEEIARGALPVSDSYQYNNYIQRITGKAYHDECRRIWKDKALTELYPSAPEHPPSAKGGMSVLSLAAGNEFAKRALRLCAKMQLTVSSLVYLAFGRTLMRICQTQEAGFISTGSGRTADYILLTGMFTGVFPVRVTGTDTPASIQDQLVSASHYPVHDPAVFGLDQQQITSGNYAAISIQNNLYEEQKPDIFQSLRLTMADHTQLSVPEQGFLPLCSLSVVVYPEAPFRIIVAYEKGINDKSFKDFGTCFLASLRELAEEYDQFKEQS